jgi:hypothetical protein
MLRSGERMLQVFVRFRPFKWPLSIPIGSPSTALLITLVAYVIASHYMPNPRVPEGINSELIQADTERGA